MEYLITAYPSTPTPAMILTPPARAYSPSPSPDPEQEPQPIASTSQLAPSTSRRVFDYVLLPRLPAGWLSAAPGGRASEPVQDDKACHQCRNAKNPHPRFRCGRAGCLRAFCSSCLSRRYGWTPQEIHERGCPDCRGVCNCSRCLDRAGLSAHKAFLTADARAGGCARKWLAERGLLVEGAAAPQPPKKNMARRPRILAKKMPDEGTKKKRTQKEEEEEEEETRGRGPGRWIIDASEKLVKRCARERAARVAQVRAGTRRWFAGASPPPRPRARDDTAGAPPVETIDLTLDDDEDDARDSLFDADGDGQPARGGKTDEEDDAPDSLFDEKTDDGDAPEQHDAAAAAAAQNDVPMSTQIGAPDDKDDDADSLFDGDPGTPAAPSPHIPPAPVQLPSTPVQLAPTPVHLPSMLVQLPPAPTPVQLPPTPIQLPPTPIQLPPAGSTQDTLSLSLSLSDSYADALRVDGELGVVGPSSSAPGSPAKPGQAAFGGPFTPTTAAFLPAAPASPIAAPAPPVPELAPQPTLPLAPAPKTVSKAASAMFIPRAKRKRDNEDEETRLDSVKSSAGVLVALGRPGRAKRVREDDVHALQDDALVPVPVEKDDAIAQKDDMQTQKDGAIAQKDGAPAAQKDGAPAAQKRPREDTALANERPAKRPALSKETAARRSRAGVVPYHSSPDDEPPVRAKETARKPPRAPSSRQEDSDVVDGLPTPKPTLDKRTAEARPSAADALAQAMRAAYGGASTADPKSSAPVASGSSAHANNMKRGKPSVLAQRVAQASGSSLAIALKTPASAAAALAAAYKQAYAARPASPASTLRSSPTPEPPALEKDASSSSPTRASKPALNAELSSFIGGFDDEDKDEPTPELLPSDLAAQSEGSSRTGPVSPVVAYRRPPNDEEEAEEEEEEEEMPARRPFVPCNPRRFVGMPLRFVPAKRPRAPPAKKATAAVIDVDATDEYKDEDEEQDFGLARRRKRTKMWKDSVVLQSQAQAHEPVIVLDDSDDSDFQPAPALVSKGTGKGKAKSFGPGKGKSKSFGPGKGKSKPRKLPLSSFIAYSYTPPPSVPDPEPESMPEPVFVPDDDTAAAPPASEVWLGAAMAPLSPDLGLTRAVADAWFSAV